MICKQCGATNKEGSGFCSACGGALRADSPKKQKVNQEMTDLVDKVAEYWRWIIGGFSVVVLILGILNLVCALPVFQTTKMGSVRDSGYITVSMASNNLRKMGGGFGAGVTGNVLFGLANLLVAGVGIMYFLKKERNLTYYDQYIAKVIKTEEPAFLMGLVGAGAAVTQMILYLLCNVPESTYFPRVSVGVHWINWVALVLYGGLIAVSILLKKKKA